jgi:hypothetical protein
MANACDVLIAYRSPLGAQRAMSIRIDSCAMKRGVSLLVGHWRMIVFASVAP